MKTNLLFLAVIFACILNACKDDGIEIIKEVPDEIIPTEPNPILYSRIIELFPDGIDVSVKYPFLFSDTVQKRIILTSESEVYVTFIAEGANFKNTLGWYSYTLGAEPKSIHDIKLHTLFPNISGKGEGGELYQGDMLQIGDRKFPAGTVIGFFLIVNGWHNGSIDYTGTTHLTDYAVISGGKQQHILFQEKNCGAIVMGYEDKISTQSDRDYNDILFTISDNRDGYVPSSFDLAKIPRL
jgi:hypothetical protein